ncbi:MAG: 2,4-dihydroxyhept-2-ene,7-dioic acid aldolase [Rhodoferax sp.]|nr:2,4-dihydroxyhept-2-ene,7-dioic acid aldolase [Rhodoferax sp.]
MKNIDANHIKQRWHARDKTLNGWLMSPAPFVAELMANAGYDTVTVDLQHGLHDYASAVACLQAMQAHGATVFARVPSNEVSIIGKLLDAGVVGIICPMVNSAADAKKLVDACRYPPWGERSFGPTRAMLHAGVASYVERANEEVIVLVMIETREAVENVEQIVATPGLDGVYIGPSDLGLSLGFGTGLDRQEPEMLRAIERILEVAHRGGKYAGIHTGGADYAARMLAQGFDFATLPSDATMLQTTARALVSAARASLQKAAERQ